MDRKRKGLAAVGPETEAEAGAQAADLSTDVVHGYISSEDNVQFDARVLSDFCLESVLVFGFFGFSLLGSVRGLPPSRCFLYIRISLYFSTTAVGSIC